MQTHLKLPANFRISPFWERSSILKQRKGNFDCFAIKSFHVMQNWIDNNGIHLSCREKKNILTNWEKIFLQIGKKYCKILRCIS